MMLKCDFFLVFSESQKVYTSEFAFLKTVAGPAEQ